MVRTGQAETEISTYFETLVKNRADAEIGLLLGKPNVGSRDFLIALVKTPPPEGGSVITVATASAPAAKKGQKVKSAVSTDLDEGWVITHAENVSRTLPGGVTVMGVYVFAPDAALQSATSQFSSMLSHIHEMNAPSASVADAYKQLVQAPLLLHFDSSNRKLSLKEAPTDAPGSFKPCDLKFGPTLSGFVCLIARHKVCIELPASAQSVHTLQQQLSALITAECSCIQSAVALIDGTLPTAEQLLSDAFPSASSVDQPVDVQLLRAPFSTLHLPSSTASTSSSKKVDGLLFQADGHGFLHGWVEGRAYLHKRETVGRAIAEVKADLQKSLQARVDLVLEEATASQEPGDEGTATESNAQTADPLPKHPLLQEGCLHTAFSVALPRRVLLPWKSGLCLSDYLMEYEGVGAAVERAAEVLGLDALDESHVMEVEAAADRVVVSRWSGVKVEGVVKGGAAGGGMDGGFKCTSSMIAACAAGMVALLAVPVNVWMSSGQ